MIDILFIYKQHKLFGFISSLTPFWRSSKYNIVFQGVYIFQNFWQKKHTPILIPKVMLWLIFFSPFQGRNPSNCVAYKKKRISYFFMKLDLIGNNNCNNIAVGGELLIIVMSWHRRDPTSSMNGKCPIYCCFIYSVSGRKTDGTLRVDVS